MKRIVIVILIMTLVILGCASCKKEKQWGNNVVSKDNVIFYLDFEEEDKYVKDISLHQSNEFLVENIFNNASFKESTPALRREGVMGKSLSFDGWSNFIDTLNTCGLDNQDSLSFNVWIAPRVWELPTDILCPIVEYYDSGADSGFIFGYSKYGTWGLKIKLKNIGWVYISDPTNKLELYEWVNLGFTYDKEARVIKLYKNGEVVSTYLCNTERERTFATLKFGINTYQQTAQGLFKHNMFSGLMDELYIYNKALSKDEMKQLYTRLLVNGKVKECGYENVQYPLDYLKDDIYKPTYHSSANIDWSSDASGGFYYNGMYHQFYQSDDTGPIWRTFTWGHLVSKDMVNWYSVEPAIYAEDNKIDSYSTFAGSAIVINNRPYIVYTGISFNDSETSKLSLATPVDLNDPELKKWEKLDIVITLPPEIKIRGEFRDPFVYEEDGFVYILATASANQTGDITKGNPSIIGFKASVNDLTKWEYTGIFFTLNFSEQKKIGFMWELPQLYKLTSPNGQTKYMFTCTPVKKGDIINDMLYWIGDFDKKTCTFIPDTETVQLLDKGSNVLCAGSGFNDDNTGKNMSTSVIQCVGQRSEHDRVFSGWVGCYQLWRNYSLNDDLSLAITFNQDYEILHDKKLLDIKSRTNIDNVDLTNVTGRALHIKLTMDVKESYKAGLNVLTNKYNNQGVSFYYEKENGRFVLNTLYSKSQVQLCNYEYFDVIDGKIELDIFIDKSVVEFTVNNRYAFTARAFTNVTSDLIKFVGQDWEILSMEVYTMKSIF